MFYINIDENTREQLELTLAKLTVKLKKDSCIDCIYFTMTKNFRRNGKDILKITIVRNDNYIDKE